MLELQSVYKSYGQGDIEHRVLEDVTWKFSGGKFTALFGKSGTGKSTVLNLLSGLDQPDRGVVRFEGQDIYSLSDRYLSEVRMKYFGFIFQSFNLITNLTVYENVEYPLYLCGEPSVSRQKKTNEILERVGLGEFAQKLPTLLSGGQRQRVAIARALVKSPKVIFADEPTANLDETTGNEIVSLLKNLQKTSGATIIYVTHDVDILNISDESLNLVNRKIGIHVRS